MGDLEQILKKVQELHNKTKNLSIKIDRFIENYNIMFEKYLQTLPRGSKPTGNDLAVYGCLSDDGLTAKNIQKETGLPQPSISSSLKRLRSFGLVKRQFYEGEGARYIYFKNKP